MTVRSHEPDCTLYSVHWLRHAVAAAGRLANPGPEDVGVDNKSAEYLADTLAYFAELPEWETVTLLDVAERATPMDEDGSFEAHCTCRQE